jgi:hypothetical protein
LRVGERNHCAKKEMNCLKPYAVQFRSPKLHIKDY